MELLSILILWLDSWAGVPDMGLIAHYNFNRDPFANETILWDLSGNDNHGSIQGKATYVPDRFGTACGALYFDGNTYCSVPSSPTLKSPDYGLTIAAWLRIADKADFFRQWMTICCKSDQVEESYDSPQYRMQATAQTVSLNSELTEVFIPPLDYETWYFYAYVFDGLTLLVFLNGSFVYETLYTGKLHANDFPLEIGRDIPGTTEFFKGTLDDLKIYSRALRDAELQTLYREKNPKPGGGSWCEVPVQVPVADPVVVVVQDTPAVAQQDTPYRSLPPRIGGDPVDYQSTVEVSAEEVQIYLFDNEKEDGDTISLNINGVWVRENYRLRLRSASPEPEATIRCQLFKGADNYLVSKAINLGSIPPNTLTIAIDDGVKVQEVTLNSDVGLHGGLLIRVK